MAESHLDQLRAGEMIDGSSGEATFALNGTEILVALPCRPKDAADGDYPQAEMRFPSAPGRSA